MNKEKNPYIDQNYKQYEDERWTDIPAVKILKTKVKLTKKQQEKANNFEKFITEQIEKEKNTKKDN